MQIMKTKVSLFFSIYLFFQILIIQFSTHHIETLDWDINAFLVTSQEFGRGNLPFEYQYENKPPVLFFIFYLFSIVTNNNLLYIKIINDLLLFILSLLLIKISNTENSFNIWNYLPSIVFILFTSNVWFHPNYSEYISLLFISSSYVVLKSKNIKHRSFYSGLLVGFATLTNLGTVFFVVGLFVINYLNSTNKLASSRYFVIGFTSIHILIFLIYFFKGVANEYIIAMIKIPFSYIESNFIITENLTVFFKAFQNFNNYAYALLLVSISLLIFDIFKTLKYKKYLNNKYVEIGIMIICSLLFYIFAKKGYYHHLIFLLYFLPLTLKLANTKLSKNIISIILIMSVFTISSQFYNDSYNNLKNFKSIQTNYPLKTISEELKGSVNKDTKVLSTNHILILYYLDVPNFSYIVHPALYDYPEITNILKENKKVQNNEIINLLQNNPYVLEGNFNFDDLNNNYTRLNTNNINLDFLEYWKIDRSLNIFVSK